MKKAEIIDIFVTVIDNYGDMGFACEFISAIEREYGEQYTCVIWTDDVVAMSDFVTRSGVSDIIIGDISEFGPEYSGRKSAIGISILHAPIPDLVLFATLALILRIDYLSLNPDWIAKNETEHITSTSDRRIIELIPSVLEGGAGLIAPAVSRVSIIADLSQDPAYQKDSSKMTGFLSAQEWQIQSKPQKHITIFTYPSTIDRIDWDSFPSDLTVYVFGIVESKKANIICLDFLPTDEFYALLDTSEFAIIRWEVSWAHMIQGSVPFLWDMYHGIGGWPSEQSEQFLEFI